MFSVPVSLAGLLKNHTNYVYETLWKGVEWIMEEPI